jgi:hypothetical protein
MFILAAIGYLRNGFWRRDYQMDRWSAAGGDPEPSDSDAEVLLDSLRHVAIARAPTNRQVLGR